MASATAELALRAKITADLGPLTNILTMHLRSLVVAHPLVLLVEDAPARQGSTGGLEVLASRRLQLGSTVLGMGVEVQLSRVEPQ